MNKDLIKKVRKFQPWDYGLNLDLEQEMLRALCKRSNIKLIEVDYRLSDEQVINLLNKELNEVQEKVKES